MKQIVAIGKMGPNFKDEFLYDARYLDYNELGDKGGNGDRDILGKTGLYVMVAAYFLIGLSACIHFARFLGEIL